MQTDPQQAMLAAYKKFFESPEGALILGDMVIFAQQTDDPAVRVGRSDAILRILRSSQRGQELTETRTVRGRASTQAQSEQE